jgi:phytoene synthase
MRDALQDAFAYCADLVRSADRDRFIATLFAPEDRRGALHALYAFNAEVARVREVAREPLPGEIRLQWWTDVLSGVRPGEAAANPVAAALLAAIDLHGLEAATLIDLIEARRFDLYDEPMATLSELEVYARKTSSAIFALAEQILAGTTAEAVVTPAGEAYAIAELLRTLPLHTARRQLYLPLEILQRHGVQMSEIFAHGTLSGLNAALSELRNLARRHLAALRATLGELPQAVIPALLPVALVRPILDRLERSEPWNPRDIAPWRRQWLIWRAARNPGQIAG